MSNNDDMLVKRLSLSKIGDLLKDRLGEEAEDYTFPEDFEKAIVDIGFNALVQSGDSSPYDLIVIGDDALNRMYRYQDTASSKVPNESKYKSVSFVSCNPTNIPMYCFVGQNYITAIQLPESVVELKRSSFEGCSSLQEVDLSHVNKIYARSFVNCTSLSKVTFGSNIRPITVEYSYDTSDMFFGGTNLKTVGPGSEYDMDITALVEIPTFFFGRNTGITNVVIPNTCTKINMNAFLYCSNLQNVTIPDSVTKLDSFAFRGCSSIQSIVANGWRTGNFGYESNIFHDCTSLRTAVFEKLTDFVCGTNNNYGLFRNCPALESVQMGSVGYPVTRIAAHTFASMGGSSPTITIYTVGSSVSSLLSNIRNGATTSTIVMKAATDTEYNGVTYSAGDTILTSVPASE